MSSSALTESQVATLEEMGIGFVAEGLNAGLGAETGLNVAFVLFSGYLVFVMQLGFAALTAGSVRAKNTKNVLVKNLLDAVVGALFYYLFGYAWAYGAEANGFIGYRNFALAHVPAEASFESWFFQWAFAATAATIVSGAVAERTSFYAYLGYAAFLVGWVYPVVSHWIWDPRGWLSAFKPSDWLFGSGAIDFAGSGVVHMVGGFSGLCGAWVVGPRIGRFDADGKPRPMPGHSAALCTIGTFVLWFGWYGFNPGSALAISPPPLDIVVPRVAVNTTLAAAASGFTTMVIVKLRDDTIDLISILNGVLAGLVAITAPCSVVEPYAAIVIGIVAAPCYIGAAMLELALGVDDPLEAWAIHGACGALGVFSVGLLARQALRFEAGYPDGATAGGLFYGEGIALLGAQVIEILVIIGWVCFFMLPFFLALNRLGLLRVPREEELAGMDVTKHGGSAYPVDEDEAMPSLAKKDNMGYDESLAAEADEPPRVVSGDETNGERRTQEV